MIKLDKVTIIAIDCYNYGGAVSALKKSMVQCEFAAVKLLTDIPIKIDGIEIVQISPIKSKEEYSRFCIKELHKYFDTEFVLVIQHDGFVLDGKCWDNEFYNYDFIGSPWLYQDGRNVGNGGFSLRSMKLQKILGTDSNIKICSPEDEIIGRLYRDYLIEEHNIKFPSEEIADTFSFELRTPIQSTFGFHGYFHNPYQPTVLIKRAAAMGDVVMVEPVMRYFHDKGYRVVLDTLPQFHLLFINHDFKVHRVGEVDQRLLETARVVNLDMSYESNPKQLHLKSYFEYAGIIEEEYTPYLKSPKLSVGFPLTKETKLFEKYCILHVDNRPQASRNVYGVDWEVVVSYLIELGYTPIQLGKDDTAEIPNAIKLNCTNENFLCYVVGGADLMVGIDSGIANIAAGFSVPCVILFGSVAPMVIHPEWNNKIAIHNHDNNVCDKPFCWGDTIGCEGTHCYIDNQNPPCTKFTTSQVISSITKILKLENE